MRNEKSFSSFISILIPLHDLQTVALDWVLVSTWWHAIHTWVNDISKEAGISTHAFQHSQGDDVPTQWAQFIVSPDVTFQVLKFLVFAPARMSKLYKLNTKIRLQHIHGFVLVAGHASWNSLPSFVDDHLWEVHRLHLALRVDVYGCNRQKFHMLLLLRHQPQVWGTTHKTCPIHKCKSITEYQGMFQGFYIQHVWSSRQTMVLIWLLWTKVTKSE